MAFADPRWLEILKSSGGQCVGAAVACGLLLLIRHWGWLPPFEPWMVIAVWFGLLLFGCLAIVALVSGMLKIAPVHEWVIDYINDRHTTQQVKDYIPFMTEQERRIIGYLIAHNQKQFIGEVEGGYAVTLIAHGIVAFDVPSNPNQTTLVPMWRCEFLIQFGMFLLHIRTNSLTQELRFHPGSDTRKSFSTPCRLHEPLKHWHSFDYKAHRSNP